MGYHQGRGDALSHALQCALNISQLQQAGSQSGTWQWPAITSDGGWATYAGVIKIGSLFAIPPSVSIASLGLPNAESIAVATALQNFGVYVINKGGSGSNPTCIIYCETETPSAAVTRLRAGWPTIVNQLRKVTNSAQATPAGLTSSGSYPPAFYPAPTPVAVPA